jgi:hypothetical protein
MINGFTVCYSNARPAGVCISRNAMSVELNLLISALVHVQVSAPYINMGM